MSDLTSQVKEMIAANRNNWEIVGFLVSKGMNLIEAMNFHLKTLRSMGKDSPSKAIYTPSK